MYAGEMKWKVGYDFDKTGIEQAKRALQEIQDLATNKMSLGGLSDADLKKLKTARESAEQLSTALQEAYNPKLGTYNLSQIVSSTGKDINKLYEGVKLVGANGEQAVRNTSVALLTQQTQLKQTSALLTKIGTTLKNTFIWTLSSSVINNGLNTIRKAYQYVEELDTSLNDIRIVTNKSAADMEKFARQANKAAEALGKNTRAYTEASLIYYQQGLSDNEVQARTATTLKAANVTGQTTDTVSEQLTAVWNGYKVTAAETEKYVDKLSAVAASTASDLEELSRAMSKVASAANTMGVDVDQLTAQISTIISVTRDAPETVGTALRTVYARMSTIQSGGVAEEDGATLTSYSKKMADLGINVLDANNQLRDMGDVIEEIGNKWNTMSKAQQVNLAQVMAGTRQYNNIITLFENWDMYQDALQTSQNSMGTLQKQQDIYMESTEAHLKKLKAAAEGLYDTLIDSKTINGILNLLTGLTHIADTLVSSLGGGLNALHQLGAVLVQVYSSDIANGILRLIHNFELLKDAATNAAAEEELAREFGENALNSQAQGYQKIINLIQERQKVQSVLSQQEIDDHKKLIAQLNDEYIAQDKLQKGIVNEYNKFGTLSAAQSNNDNETFIYDIINADDLTEVQKTIDTIQNMVEDNANSIRDKVKTTIHDILEDIAGSSIENSKVAQRLKQDFKTKIDNSDPLQKRKPVYYTTNDLVGNDLNQEFRALTQFRARFTQEQSKVIFGEDWTNNVDELINRVNAYRDELLANGEGAFDGLEDGEKGFRNIIAWIEEMEQSISYAKDTLKVLDKDANTFFGNAQKGLKDTEYRTSSLETQAKNMQAAFEKKQTVTQLVTVAGAVGQIATQIRQAISLGEVWNDSSRSVLDKTLTTLTSLSFIIVGMLNSVKQLSKAWASSIIPQAIATKLAKQYNEYVNVALNGVPDNEKDSVIQKVRSMDWKPGTMRKISYGQDGHITLGANDIKVIRDPSKFNAPDTKLRFKDILNTPIKSLGKGAAATSTGGAAGAGAASGLTILGAIGITAGALAAIAVTAGVIYATYTKQTRALEKMKKVTTELESATAKVAEEYKTLTDNMKSLQTASDTLHTLAVGSSEWKEQLESVNDQVRNLLQLYPQLAQYASRNELGELSIDQTQLGALQQDLLNQKNALSAASLYAQQQVNEQQLVVDTQAAKRKNGGSFFDWVDLWNILPLIGPIIAGVENNKREDIRTIFSDKSIEKLTKSFNLYGENAETYAEIIGVEAETINKYLPEIRTLIQQRNDLEATGKFNTSEVFRSQAEVNFENTDLSEKTKNSVLNAVSSAMAELYGDELNKAVDDTKEKVKRSEFKKDSKITLNGVEYTGTGKVKSGENKGKFGFVSENGAELYLEKDAAKEFVATAKALEDFKDESKETQDLILAFLESDAFNEFDDITKIAAAQAVLTGEWKDISQLNIDSFEKIEKLLTKENLEEIFSKCNVTIISSEEAEDNAEEAENKYSELEASKYSLEESQKDFSNTASLINYIGEKGAITDYQKLEDADIMTKDEAESLLGSSVEFAKLNVLEQLQKIQNINQNAETNIKEIGDFTDEDLRDKYLKEWEKEYQNNLNQREEEIKTELADYFKVNENLKDTTDNWRKQDYMEFYSRIFGIGAIDTSDTETLGDYVSRVFETVIDKRLQEELGVGYNGEEAFRNTSFNKLADDAQRSALSNYTDLKDARDAINHTLMQIQSTTDAAAGGLLDLNALSVMSDHRISWEELDTLLASDLGNIIKSKAEFDEATHQFILSQEQWKNILENALAEKQQEFDAGVKVLDTLEEGSEEYEQQYLNVVKLSDAINAYIEALSDIKDKTREYEALADYFYKVNKQLELQQHLMSIIQTQQSNLYGSKLVNNLTKQNNILAQQNKLLQQQADIAQSRINYYKTSSDYLNQTFQGIRVNIDDNGIITNKLEIELAYIEALKHASGATADAIQKEYDAFEEIINQYDEYVSKFRESSESITSNLYQASQNRIDALTATIQPHFDFTEAEKELRDWEKEFGSITLSARWSAETLQQTNLQTAQFAQDAWDANWDDVEEYSKMLNEANKALLQLESGNSTTLWGQNLQPEDLLNVYDVVAQLKDKLKEVYEDAVSAQEEAHKALLAEIDNYNTITANIQKNMQLIDKRYENRKKYISMLYGDTDIAAQTMQMQLDNQLFDSKINQLSQLQNLVDESREQYNKAIAENDAEQAQKWYDIWTQAIDDFESKTEESLTAALTKFTSSIATVTTALTQQLSKGTDWSFLQEEWDLLQNSADMYLDTVNSSYELYSLQNKYLDAIDDTSLVSTQTKLRNIMEEELKILQAKDRLTQFDIDYANAKYELTLKQIALEEAQNSKTTLRLRRDSLGNYSYQFTANEEATRQAEQDVANAQNKLYNLTKNATLKSMSSWLKSVQEATNDINQTLAKGTPEALQEAQKKIDLWIPILTNTYKELGLENETLVQQAIESLERQFTEAATGYDETLSLFGEDIQKLFGEDEDSIRSTFEVAFADMLQQAETYTEDVSKVIEGSSEVLGTVEEEYNALNSSLEKLKTNTTNVFGNMDEQLQTLLATLQGGEQSNIPFVTQLANVRKELKQMFDIQTSASNLLALQNINKELQNEAAAYESITGAAAKAKDAIKNYLEIAKEKESFEAGGAQGIQEIDGHRYTSVVDVSGFTRGDELDAFYNYVSRDYKNATGTYINDIKDATKYDKDFYINEEDGYMIFNGILYWIGTKESNKTHHGGGAVGNSNIITSVAYRTFDTGGYTGEWDNSGRIALLHQKELVLNQFDTQNILNTVTAVRDLAEMYGNAQNNAQAYANKIANSVLQNTTGQTSISAQAAKDVKQTVAIEANFPNVVNSQEIEEAFNDLLNRAMQQIYTN